MRDIKFRAWDKKKNDWFDDDDGELYIELNGNINFGWNGEVMDDYTDRVVLMQYTGKKDVNGVEIYEDYILACYGGFTDLGCTLQANVEVEDIYEMAFIIRNCDKYEVIGNIHENPELLED